MGWLDPVFVALSIVGYAGLVWVALAPALALWTRNHVVTVTAVTATTVWTTDLTATLAKAAIGRPRPFEVIAEADPLLRATVGTSLPSGHAATSFAGAVLLTVLVRRAVPALFLLAALIAFSRVYVGAHYPLDVFAGAALGAAAGGGAALAAAGVVRSRRRPSGAPPRSGGAPPPG